MKSCGTFWLAWAKWPGSAEIGLLIHSVLSTLQSASVTPFGSTLVVAWKVQVAPAASGVGLLHCQTLGPTGPHAAPENVVGLVLRSRTWIGAGCGTAPMFLTETSNLHSQFVLLGSEAQPLAVLLITSLGNPAQAGLTLIGWLADAESLPLGFCTEPGLGVTMATLLFAVQTVGPGA